MADNGVLRNRGYKLPLEKLPPQLTIWARAIVRYQLNRNRMDDADTDPVVRDYKDALVFLQKIADGKYSLGIEYPLPVKGGAPQVTGPKWTFDMHTLQHFGK
ncbi:MAG: phage protein Gp36 family protein [Candidatus Malihini olakiniferum]